MISEQIKIGYETEKAIIYMGRKDIIKLIEKKLSYNNLPVKFDKTIIKELTTNLDTLKIIRNDFTVSHWEVKQDNVNLHDYFFAGFIDQIVLKELILKGKVEILNKSTNNLEKRIVYHFVRDKLGSEMCYYTFENEIEFYQQLVSLGE